MTKTWPAPLLQPDPHDGCILYSVAYLCHCFGHTDVTPEQVQAFRAETKKGEWMYPVERLGVDVQQWRWWDLYPDGDYQKFWLGPATREWVEQRLQQGELALVTVERVVGKAHAIVLLDSLGDEGVYVHDPLYGLRVDTWEWFLSVGPGNHGCHHVEGWYKYAPTASKMEAVEEGHVEMVSFDDIFPGIRRGAIPEAMKLPPEMRGKG